MFGPPENKRSGATGEIGALFLTAILLNGCLIDRLETDILNPEILNYRGKAYLQGADPGCPEVNLSLAHLNGLPPVLLQYGDAEIFYDQIQTIASRLQAEGVEVFLSGCANRFHVFQSGAGLLLSWTGSVV